MKLKPPPWWLWAIAAMLAAFAYLLKIAHVIE